MKIIDLLKLCSYENVEKQIVLYVWDEDLEEYQKLYQIIKNGVMKNHHGEDLYICIIVRQKNDMGTDPAIELFDENDANVYFDISEYEASEEVLHSIASLSYENFLRYSIEKDTLEKFDYESILAYVRWKFTSYGFEDKF